MTEKPVNLHHQQGKPDPQKGEPADQVQNSDRHRHSVKMVEPQHGSTRGDILELNERVAKLETRLDNAEDDMREWRAEIRQAANEVRDLKEQIRFLGSELRAAIGQVASNAAKPFEQLHWGWRVFAGIGTFALGLVSIMGGVLGILAFLRSH